MAVVAIDNVTLVFFCVKNNLNNDDETNDDMRMPSRAKAKGNLHFDQ